MLTALVPAHSLSGTHHSRLGQAVMQIIFTTVKKKQIEQMVDFKTKYVTCLGGWCYS